MAKPLTYAERLAPLNAVEPEVAMPSDFADIYDLEGYNDFLMGEPSRFVLLGEVPASVGGATIGGQVMLQGIDTRELKNASIQNAKIADLAVTNAKIEDAAIDSAKIEDLSVTTAKIALLAVDTAQIADAAIENAKIGLLAVDTANIADAAIENAKIANLAVDTAQIANAAIETAKIANLAVDTAQIANAAIEEAKINNLAVTNAKIANTTITGAKIANATIDTAQIANAAITNAKIGNLAVDTAQIANAAIEEAKIGSLAVTNAKIANTTITGAKIANATIDTAQITNAAITNAKINDLSADKITAGTLTGRKIQTHSSSTQGVKMYTTDYASIANGYLEFWDNVSDSGVIYYRNSDAEFYVEGGNWNVSSDISCDKITRNTEDPILRIDDVFYSTYTADYNGQRCVYVGKVLVKDGSHMISFKKSEDIDLFVWKRSILFDDRISVLITPEADVRSWYEINESEGAITIHVDNNLPVNATIQLIGYRIDSATLPTVYSEDKPPPIFIDVDEYDINPDISRKDHISKVRSVVQDMKSSWARENNKHKIANPDKT